jgi:hypothetical protein
MHMYVSCSGATSICTWGSIGAGHVHLQKMGFLEEQLNSALEKNASKRAKGQVCMCREI